MVRQSFFLILTVFLLPGATLAQERPTSAPQAVETSSAAVHVSSTGEKDTEEEEENGDKKKEQELQPPAKTIFDWTIGPEPVEENGNSLFEPEEPLVSDRPDFTEASVTVGRGRVQLEMGYAYIHDEEAGVRTHFHSFPEALLRIGVLAEWFELRIGQNFGSQLVAMNGLEDSDAGADDLYLGVKLALTEQKYFLPETALILQMFVPTGAEAFSADEALPGFNYIYSWEVIEGFLNVAGNTILNRMREDSGHSYLEIFTTLTVGYEVTPRFVPFTELAAIIPHSAVEADTGPQYLFHFGAIYRVTNDIQLDWHAAIGLNRHADDYLVGGGLVMRY